MPAAATFLPSSVTSSASAPSTPCMPDLKMSAASRNTASPAPAAPLSEAVPTAPFATDRSSAYCANRELGGFSSLGTTSNAMCGSYLLSYTSPMIGMSRPPRHQAERVPGRIGEQPGAAGVRLDLQPDAAAGQHRPLRRVQVLHPEVQVHLHGRGRVRP